MAIEKVSLAYIEGSLRKVNKTLKKCCESGCFHMNPPPDTSGTELAAKNLKDKGLYERMIKRAKALADNLGVKLDENAPFDEIEYNVGSDFKKYLDELDRQQAGVYEEQVRINSEIRSKSAIYHNLLGFSGFDADFAELLACKYLKPRFGRIPNGSIKKLDFYTEKTFFFYQFEKKENYTWCLYITTTAEANNIDFLFGGLGFERSALPDYLKGSTDEAARKLLSEMDEDLVKLGEADKKLKEIAAREGDKLSKVYAKLVSLNSSYELRANVTVFDNSFHFSGYVPTKDVKRFTEMINSVGDVTVNIRDVTADDKAPVMLKNNWLFRPFEMFVKMYGLPAANGMDPTPLVAITYMLLYGMMFGDLGQGLCIMILGIILTKVTKAGLAPIIARIGVSSSLFGILYGSVFGNEEIIQPFFRLPKIYELFGYTEAPHDVFKASNMFLILALIVGVCLILTTMIVNIIVSLRMGDLESGIFGANGICGFVFYGSLIVGLGGGIALGIELMTPAYIIGLIALPLLLIFFKEPILHALESRGIKPARTGKGSGGIDTGLKEKLAKMQEGKPSEKKSVGMFIIEGFIDLFEICLSYLSNTMSYLRIGGFVLSHAGLMLVFSIIADMFDGAGSVAVLVFGNIFVTGFEGFIVGIQVLRLEFYELFSRFFKGGGIPFKSVSINTKVQV